MVVLAQVGTVSTAHLILYFIAIGGYILGMTLHIKIIRVSKKQKEMTWKMDVTNSCLIISIFTLHLIIEGIVLVVPDFFEVTGENFCYALKFVGYYGNIYVFSHSLIIVILKYIRIVRWKKVLLIGKDKLTEMFFWVNFLHPILVISLRLITNPDFFTTYEGYNTVSRCSERFNHDSGLHKENRSQTRLHHLCEFEKPLEENDYLGYILFVLRTTLCGTLYVNYLFIIFNIYEMLFYYKIFGFMRR